MSHFSWSLLIELHQWQKNSESLKYSSGRKIGLSSACSTKNKRFCIFSIVLQNQNTQLKIIRESSLFFYTLVIDANRSKVPRENARPSKEREKSITWK